MLTSATKTVWRKFSARGGGAAVDANRGASVAALRTMLSHLNPRTKSIQLSEMSHATIMSRGSVCLRPCRGRRAEGVVPFGMWALGRCRAAPCARRQRRAGATAGHCVASGAAR